MTDSHFPFKTALDPIAHKFPLIPRFVFDRLGVLINRDDVRTPMQWDSTNNAGFSSAPKTWLPAHENYTERNVQKESAETDSLLNTIRALLRVRTQEQALQEGSLELLDNLPNGVLGYVRKAANGKVVILLNFDHQEKEFQFECTECLFNISKRDEAKQKAIRLDGLGGMILRMD